MRLCGHGQQKKADGRKDREGIVFHGECGRVWIAKGGYEIGGEGSRDGSEQREQRRRMEKTWFRTLRCLSSVLVLVSVLKTLCSFFLCTLRLLSPRQSGIVISVVPALVPCYGQCPRLGQGNLLSPKNNCESQGRGERPTYIARHEDNGSSSFVQRICNNRPFVAIVSGLPKPTTLCPDPCLYCTWVHDMIDCLGSALTEAEMPQQEKARDGFGKYVIPRHD